MPVEVKGVHMKRSFKVALIVLVVAALAVGGVALAQTDDDDQSVADHPGYRHMLELLSDLIDQGVITQEQAEAVAEHLVLGGPGPVRPGVGSHRPGVELLEEAAGILNMTVEDLRERLIGGATLADIAGGQANALIARLVDAAEARIEAAFDDGRITEEQRDRALETVTERITRFVEEGPCPIRPRHHGPRHGPHFGGGEGGPRFGPGPGGEPGFAPGAEI
jgi:hypothetical protein